MTTTTKVSKASGVTLSDSELDLVTGGTLPNLAPKSAWVVGPEFNSVFSRYVIGRYTKQPE
jgi:hypothetical protein